jgi:hypothetical protein
MWWASPWTVAAPLLIAASPVLALVDALVQIAVARERIRQALRGELSGDGGPVCTTCGYNLTGNTSGRRPECGANIPNPSPNVLRIRDREDLRAFLVSPGAIRGVLAFPNSSALLFTYETSETQPERFWDAVHTAATAAGWRRTREDGVIVQYSNEGSGDSSLTTVRVACLPETATVVVGLATVDDAESVEARQRPVSAGKDAERVWARFRELLT